MGDRRFKGEDGAEALGQQKRGQMGQVEQWRYISWRSSKETTQCW